MGLFLATRAAPSGPPRAFRDRERLLEALARGDLALDDAVRVGGRATTAGRFLAHECPPPSVRGDCAAWPWTARRVAEALSLVTRELHVELAARSAAAMERLGLFVVERSGLSLAAGDFAPPPERHAIVAEARARVAGVERQYHVDGLITDGERYNKAVDLWAEAVERIRAAARSRAPEGDPLAALAASARDAPSPERLRTPPGLLTNAWGSIVERPVLQTPAEGSDAHGYMILCVAARARALDQRSRDRAVAAVLHDLHAVLSGVRVVARDCGTRHGVRVRRIEHEWGEAALTLAARVEGRVTAEAVAFTDGRVLAPAGAVLGRELAARVGAANVPFVRVRDARTCEAPGGVCATCFGLDPDDATWPAEGDEVGARAALTIAREARSFSTRTFRICGITGRMGSEAHRTAGGGAVRYAGLSWVPCPEDSMTPRECLEGGAIEVLWGDAVMETFPVQPGDALLVEDGATVEPGAWLLRRTAWERRLRAAIPEGATATARWGEAPSVELVNEYTGLSAFTFAPGDEDVALRLLGDDGRELATLAVPREATTTIAEGEAVRRGQVVARVPQPRQMLRAIDGLHGLRCLLDARPGNPWGVAVVAPCDGHVGSVAPASVELKARDGRAVRVFRRRRAHLAVRVGDYVRAGDPLVDGNRSHHRLLRAWGEERLADHLVGELELETHLRGLDVPRAYWSLAVRAMLAWRRVVKPGDTGLRRNRVLARDEFERVQRETVARGGEPATAVTVLRGFRAMARERLRGGQR